MVVCKQCGKTIVNTGRNPATIYSTCSDCSLDKVADTWPELKGLEVEWIHEDFPDDVDSEDTANKEREDTEDKA